MQTRLIAIGVSAFSYGALLGWALTADHKDRKIKEQQRIISKLVAENSVVHNTFVYNGSEVPAESEEELISADEIYVESDRNPTPLGVFRSVSTAVKDAKEAVPEVDLTPIRGDDVALVTINPEGLMYTSESAGVETPSEDENSPEGDTAETDEAYVALESPEMIFNETPEQTKAHLQHIINEYTANENDRRTFVETASKIVEGADLVPPFVITQAQYAYDEEEGADYDKITLQYFPRERLLLDDDEDPIEVDEYVGWRNLNRFGDDSGDADTVFVRNRRLETDFEVVRSEDHPPLHVRYGMSRAEYEIQTKAGVFRTRDGDG